MSLKNSFFYGFWLILTLILAYWFCYPLDVFSRHYFFGGLDLTPDLWVFNWQLSQMSSGNFDQLFTGNAFYPLDRPIYFNDSVFSTVILTLPIFIVTKDPYICYQTAIFLSYVLSSLGMLLLARSLKLDHTAALLAAMIFAFSEARHGFSVYLVLNTMQWMPFVLLFAHKYFDKGKRFFLYLATLFYLVQITASAYHGIFISIILLLFIYILGSQHGSFRSKKFYWDALPPTLIAGAVAGIYFLPYLQEAHEFGFTRSISEQSAYGAPLVTFFSSPSSYFFGPWTAHFNHIDGNTSPRYLPILLTISALLILRKNSSVNLLFIPKLRNLAVGVLFLTPVIWLFKSSVASLGQKIYPALFLHPQVVTTVILSPLFLVVTAYFFMTRFFRTIYQGLRSEKILLLYFSIAMLAFVVSLGPIVKLYENQHVMVNPITTFLYYVFPGFSSVRAVSRMASLIPLGLGITAGIGYMMIKNRLGNPSAQKIFSLIVLVLLMLEVYPAKDFYAPYKQTKNKFPEEYSWLKRAPDGPVLEWPMSKSFLGDGVYLERSIAYQKDLVNGYATFEWDGRKKLAQLTDLSRNRALLSLYAFGVRYLVVHRIGGKFPDWASKNLGRFHRVKTFDNALVYLNENAKTYFLPENFLDYFSASIKTSDNKIRLTLKFNSPKSHYVSKNKKLLKVKVNWTSRPNSLSYDWLFYPTLWQDGDSYELLLGENSDRIPKSVELIYPDFGEKSVKVFREIVLS